jgi:hypothetical protein
VFRELIRLFGFALVLKWEMAALSTEVVDFEDESADSDDPRSKRAGALPGDE